MMSAQDLTHSKAGRLAVATALVLCPLIVRAQSLAELSYRLWHSRCPEVQTPNETQISQPFECGFGGAQSRLLDLVQTGQAVSENTYFASLASLRAEALTCTLSQIEALQTSPATLDQFVENTSRDLILLGQLQRRLRTLEPAVVSDAKAKREYEEKKKASEAIMTSLRFTNIPAFRYMVNHIISQDDFYLTESIDPKLEAYIKSSIRPALEKSKADLRADIALLEKGAQTGGESLSTRVRESLAQDTELLENFQSRNPNLEKSLQAVSCKVDAKYGRGAISRDQGLLVTSVLGSGMARGALNFGSRVLATTVTGAAAVGSITLKLAGVTRFVGTLAEAATIKRAVEQACFQGPMKMRGSFKGPAQTCDTNVGEALRTEDCALTAVLSSLGITGTALATQRFMTKVSKAGAKTAVAGMAKGAERTTEVTRVTAAGATRVWTAEQEAKWLTERTARVAQTIATLERTGSPARGAFGPGSMMWQVNRERSRLFAIPRMGILQLSHPTVARVLYDRSRIGADSFARVQATGEFMNKMVFGDLNQVRKMSEAMTKIHARAFDGLPLTGPEKDELFLWVHATTWDSMLQTYQKVNGTLPSDKIEKFYEETKLFADLLGIPKTIVPKTYGDFQTYMTGMRAKLVATPEAVEILKGLMGNQQLAEGLIPAGIPKSTIEGVKGWILKTSNADLPDQIKAAMPFSVPSGDSSYDLRLAGKVIQTLPSSVRFSREYRAAEARVAGQHLQLPPDHPKTAGGACPFAGLFKKAQRSSP